MIAALVILLATSPAYAQQQRFTTPPNFTPSTHEQMFAMPGRPNDLAPPCDAHWVTQTPEHNLMTGQRFWSTRIVCRNKEVFEWKSAIPPDVTRLAIAAAAYRARLPPPPPPRTWGDTLNSFLKFLTFIAAIGGIAFAVWFVRHNAPIWAARRRERQRIRGERKAERDRLADLRPVDPLLSPKEFHERLKTAYLNKHPQPLRDKLLESLVMAATSIYSGYFRPPQFLPSTDAADKPNRIFFEAALRALDAFHAAAPESYKAQDAAPGKMYAEVKQEVEPAAYAALAAPFRAELLNQYLTSKEFHYLNHRSAPDANHFERISEFNRADREHKKWVEEQEQAQTAVQQSRSGHCLVSICSPDPAH